MIFLAPAALLGILLLAIPVVVHLFKPRKMRQTPFSSLRWLKQTHQRLSRRIQWHQWLLFLVRAGCILLFVLALAKPLVGTWGQPRSVDRFVIVDGSRSMAYQVDDQPTASKRAEELALGLLKKNGPGDRTALVLTGKPPSLIAPLVADASPFLPNLAAIKPGLADTTLTSALPLVRALLPRREESDVELVFVTDHLQARWQQGDIQAFLKDLAKPPKVKVVTLERGPAENAWIAGARLIQFEPGEDRWIHVDVGHVGEGKFSRSLRLSGIHGRADETRELKLSPGRTAGVNFRVPAGVKLEDQVAELRLEPADALASDDAFFLNLDTVLARRVLLIESETPGSQGRSVGLHLRSAVESLVNSKQQALELATRTRASVTGGDIQKADVVLMAGVSELSDAALESLENRVRAGVGLVVFLGPQLNTAFSNQKFHRSLQPAEGLLPLALKTGPNLIYVQGNPGQLTNMRWTHPLLAPLHDPNFADLTQSRFSVFVCFAGTLGKNDTVLAQIDDDVPALVEHPLGAGRVLLFNTTANDDWSDLPRTKSFVPLVDGLLSYLSSGASGRNFTVGDSVTLPLPDSADGRDWTVLAPDGSKLSPRLLKQSTLHLDEVTEAGVYRVESAGRKFSFVVNTGRADSPLTPMDGKILEQWWSGAAFETVTAESLAKSLAEPAKEWPLWPALVVLAGVLLVVENLYVSRLCPRASPRVVEAVVPRRGIMQPTTR
jgi:hypothetical protein